MTDLTQLTTHELVTGIDVLLRRIAANNRVTLSAPDPTWFTGGGDEPPRSYEEAVADAEAQRKTDEIPF